jgi:hypothetical protein
MRSSLSVRLVLLMGLLIMGAMLMACGGGTSSPEPTNPPGPNTAATVTALIKEMTIVGTPTVKAVSGTTFEVDGQVKNGDSLQHDIFVKATLFNASGATIGSATVNLDNVQGGATASFAIQVTLSDPAWKKVQVVVTNVTENINGTGGD